jgi:hypothetical protein
MGLPLSTDPSLVPGQTVQECKTSLEHVTTDSQTTHVFQVKRGDHSGPGPYKSTTIPRFAAVIEAAKNRPAGCCRFPLGHPEWCWASNHGPQPDLSAYRDALERA